MIHALFYYAKVGNNIIGILVFCSSFCWGIFYATPSIVLYVSPSKLRISYLSPRMAGMAGEDQVVDVPSCFSSYVPGWCIVSIAYLLGQWLNSTVLGDYIFGREHEVQTFISGSIGEVSILWLSSKFHHSSPRVENGSRWSLHINDWTNLQYTVWRTSLQLQVAGLWHFYVVGWVWPLSQQQ